MPTRRQVLSWTAATATLAALAPPGLAGAATALPLTVVNTTGRHPNSALWIHIVGTDPAGRQCYVRADGTAVPVSPSLNGPDGYADLSIPFAGTGSTRISLPTMSGRVYVSIDTKLKFRVVTDGNGRPALQYPAAWVATDPSYTVLHDCMEFTFTPGGMYCNTTMVDMFSVPMAITLTGASTQTTGTLRPGGRAAIFAAIAANPDFRGLVVGDNLRVLAPGHGIDSNRFSRTYYDSYVNQVWNAYAARNLRVTVNSTTYTGRVTGGRLVFDRGVTAFAKPTTRDVFYCDGALAAPNDGLSGPVAAQLGAALNRSTLADHADQPASDPAQFYLPAVTNHYSAAIHRNTVDGKAYGFPFDDVGGAASYVQDTEPTGITLTLTPF
ncbi:glycosyl hydrolase [Solihabitans fulvus]|uniref:Glycosyl hydrolase n=1 Tax=Solihabitans fulvus TaxID=1892852 RepID=A0A5B2WIK7_9PSEU|nr:beta-1,3-glucanase family protein [Solihabitans fulvus]KAA2250748.1 glycosyl hydrolase [Solihabitans fulvus]